MIIYEKSSAMKRYINRIKKAGEIVRSFSAVIEDLSMSGKQAVAA